MSYRPPKKSSYGDELIDDGWSQTSNTPLSAPSPINYNQQQQQQQGVQHFGDQAPNSNQGSPQAATVFSEIPPITQEDLLFIRSWRQDSYFKRIVPLTALSFGAYFLYNKSRQLPQRVGRYVALGGICFIVGRYSYKDELKRRLATANLNTPYIQALRKTLGVTAIVNDFEGDSGISDYTSTNPSAWNPTGNIGGGSSDLNVPMSRRLRQRTYDQQAPPTNSLENPIDNEYSLTDPPSKQTTYEELRARNRGIIK